MKPLVTMRQALEDPNLLATLLPGASWRVWRVLLIAAMGEQLTAEELAVFRSITGRDEAPGEPVEELGDHQRSQERQDRGGCGAGAVPGGAVVYWRDVLKHGGEHGLLMFLASNQRQARVAFRYVDHASADGADAGATGDGEDGGHDQLEGRDRPGDQVGVVIVGCGV